ncbi:MAG: glycosyltransferase family 4 protein [Chloroflexi bacterium]|nr:glycosyltransferase family 4 protein [Chloroflexota bacterium]
MKLALNGWFYDQPHTGSGQYLRGLLDHLPLAAPDIEITLIAPRPIQLESNHASRLPLHASRSTPDAARSNLSKLKFEQLDFPAACKRINADLAHIPYWAPPLASPVPFVATIHDLIPLLIPEYNRALKARFYNALVSAATPGAAHLIADSDSSRNDIIQRLRVPPEKVTAIHLAVGPEYKPAPDSPRDAVIRQKYNLPDSYVLYLGGFQPHKNARSLLAAWTWCDGSIGEQYPLVIAGKLPARGDRFHDDLPAYAKQLGIAESVRFIGPVAEEDKPALYRGAACFVFPSRYEGFGLPPLEALACGAPVVTTAFASIPEVVGEAAYLVRDPDDTRSLGAAILAVVVNPDVVDRLATAARAQAQKFSWQRTAEETAAVYRKALRRG